MTRSSVVGSFPGADETAYDEWLRVVLGELDLPVLPELPGRGAIATMTGRALAMVELGSDLQPVGWRLTGSGSGIDHRRARSLLAQDLDALEEQAQRHDGPLKVQVCGPWTLAATVERPRGDKVLADHGARRELGEALSEGLTAHVADVRRRVPRMSALIVQIDEPALPAVLSGGVPTASGFGKHRRVDEATASAALKLLATAVTSAGAQPWVHSCARDMPWALVREAGVLGMLVDPAVTNPAGMEVLAETLEAGGFVGLGVVPPVPSVPSGPPVPSVPSAPPVPSGPPAPGSAPGSATGSQIAPSESQLAEQVLRWLDVVGLSLDDVGDSLFVTPACGLASTTPSWVREAVSLSQGCARALS